MSRAHLRAGTPPPPPPAAAVHVVRPDPAAWRQAVEAAGGDPRRCTVDPDGGITVHNAAVR